MRSVFEVAYNIVKSRNKLLQVFHLCKMYLKSILSYLPFRTLSFLFLIWSNSRFAPIGKNAGFYCDDESIKLPFNGDTIRLSYLSAVLLAVFPIFIYICEFLLRKEKITSSNRGGKSSFRFHLKYYLSGFILVAGFTEALKFSCCELRPHFFYTCLPDMSKINCSDGYITNFNCTGEGPQWLVERDIYKSFPSGHASFSFYSFVFMSVYIVSRMRHASKSLVNTVCSRGIPLLCLLWTTACCITRILDNRHFWWDVLSGVVIGLVGGLITVFTCLKASAEQIPTAKNS